MTQYFCNHLGYCSCWVSSIWWVRVNDLAFSLRRIAERVSTSFLVDRASFSFFIWVTFYWSLKFCERLVTGPELFFVIMNIIHITLCLYGYHCVSHVSRFANWWNRNFNSISVKNFHNMNFRNRSNDCAFRNSYQSLGFLFSRNRIFSAQRRSNCAPSVVSIWSNFVLFPGCNKM